MTERNCQVANQSVVGLGVVLQQGKDLRRRRVRWPGIGEREVEERMDERKGGR